MILSFPLSVIVSGAFWPALGGCNFGLDSHGNKPNYESEDTTH